MKIFLTFTSIVTICALALYSGPATSQSDDANGAVYEIAELNAHMVQFETLQRISEDIVFWQSVAIMGSEYDWTFSYNTGGTEIQDWTVRLYNTLDEVPIEGTRAKQAIARSRVLSDEEKAAGMELFAQFEEMHAIGSEVYQLLRAGDTASASDVFETRTLELRSEIARTAASSLIVLRDRSKKIALDVRLGR